MFFVSFFVQKMLNVLKNFKKSLSVGRKEETSMSKFTDEYNIMMNELQKLPNAFKGYNGSKEHIKLLDDCIERGKKVIIERGVLSENIVNQTFGIVKEMIITRHKAKKSIKYLEDCIASEKQYISTLQLENATIQAMKELAASYEAKKENMGVDELWESLIQEVSEKHKSISEPLDHNQLSHNIHHNQIKDAILLSLNTIEEETKKEGN